MQLYQKDLTIESNTTYILTFDASSPNFNALDISLIKHTPPYTNYGLNSYHTNLSDNWSSQSIEFTTAVLESTVQDARLMFWIAPYADAGDEYWIDNVILTKHCPECDEAPDNTTDPGNTTEPGNSSNDTDIPSADALPIPSEEKRWSLTFQDEFDGTSIDPSKWRGGYSSLLWCPPNSIGGGKCPDQYSGLTVSDGTLKLQPKVTSDFSTSYENRAMMHTGGNDADDAKFVQRYGYFEVRAKFPTNKNGEGNGLWISFWALPLGKTNNVHNLGLGQQQEEVDIMESLLGDNMEYTYINLHDYTFSQNSLKYPKTSVGDLSDEFHNYGLYWRDDGTKYGSMQAYFDGIPQGQPFILDRRSRYWDNGVYLILQVIPCAINNNPFGGGSPCSSSTSSDNNPLIVDYVRAYQEVQ